MIPMIKYFIIYRMSALQTWNKVHVMGIMQKGYYLWNEINWRAEEIKGNGQQSHSPLYLIIVKSYKKVSRCLSWN